MFAYLTAILANIFAVLVCVISLSPLTTTLPDKAEGKVL
jgi:hypothetical protein